MTPSEAIMEATRYELAKVFEPDNTYRGAIVGIHGDEKPPARTGPFYIGIHSPTWSQSSETNAGIDDRYGFSIGLSQRTGVVPLDKMRAALWDPRIGAMTIFTKIRQLLWVNRMEVRERASRLLKEGDSRYGGEFCEPLRIQSGRLQAVQVGPAHFRASPCEHPPGKVTTCQDHGAYFEMQYGEARYLLSTLTADGLFSKAC